MKTYKWSPTKKPERNKKILEARKKNLSYRAIAKVFKISRMRVYQIVQNGAVDKLGK